MAWQLEGNGYPEGPPPAQVDGEVGLWVGLAELARLAAVPVPLEPIASMLTLPP